uniref:C2H2-type domain-containing protein n=1 Tax=Rhodosorus marinus TaxID=101924 RepID=A0A7S0G370_9RHOD|mmetsp:Transcript_19198/g.27825  ORF Transcript_19198/g.27825 Transcript_19198/m.27825 type:complete len:265 (-) Transcript_19198:679-1473(-)
MHPGKLTKLLRRQMPTPSIIMGRLKHHVDLDGTCWERFRIVAPALSKTWSRMQVQIAHAMGMKLAESKYKVNLHHKFLDEPELCELRRDFVNKLFDRALFKSLESADAATELLALPSTEELKSREPADPQAIYGSLSSPSESSLDEVGRENVCAECGHGFRRMYELKRHIDGFHLRIRNYPCEFCGKRFSQAGHVRVHIQTVHEKAASNLCEICGRGFGTKLKLVRHRKSVHEKSRQHQCPVCHSKYFQSSDLKRHLKLRHEIH